MAHGHKKDDEEKVIFVGDSRVRKGAGFITLLITRRIPANQKPLSPTSC